MTGTVIESLIVTLGLDGSNFIKGQEKTLQGNKKLRDDSEQTAKSLSEYGKQGGEFFGEITKKALEFFAVVAAGRGIEQLYSQAVNVGAATGRAASNIGTSIPKLSAWQAMMKTVGASADDATSSLSALAQQQSAYQSGNIGGATGLMGMMRMAGVQFLNKDGAARDPSDMVQQLIGSSWWEHLTGAQQQYWGGQFGLSSGFITALHALGPGGVSTGLRNDSTTDPKAAAGAESIQAAWGQVQIEMDQLSTTVMELSAPQVFKGLTNFAAGVWAIKQALSGNTKPLDQGLQNLSNKLIPDGAGESGSTFGSDGGVNYVAPPSADQATDGQKKAMNYFVGQGWTTDQAAGIVANINGEDSTWDPKSVNPKSGAYGLFQWLGDRKKALFAKYGPNPTFDQQLAFAQQELLSSENPTGTALKKQKTAFSSGVVFNNGFERNGLGWLGQYARGSSAQDIALNYRFSPQHQITSHQITQLKAQSSAATAKAANQTTTSAASASTPVSIGDVHIHTSANTITGLTRDAARALRQKLVTQANTGLA